MRSKLLDAASDLFRARGLSDVSVAEIASAALAFPSQITYYFRSKEALFVEAACRAVLYVARSAEEQASRKMSAQDYTRALVETVMRTDAVGFFVEAMVLTRRRQDLAPLVERTVERLHAEGLRAYADAISRRGWRSQTDPDTTARRFWAIAIGVTAEGRARGLSTDSLVADMLRLVENQTNDRMPSSDANVVPLAAPARRRTATKDPA